MLNRAPFAFGEDLATRRFDELNEQYICIFCNRIAIFGRSWLVHVTGCLSTIVAIFRRIRVART